MLGLATARPPPHERWRRPRLPVVPKPAKATTCRREPAARERAGRAPDLSPWRPSTNLSGAQKPRPCSRKKHSRKKPGKAQNWETPQGVGKITQQKRKERESVCVCGSASPKAPTRQILAQGGQGPLGHLHPTSSRPPLHTALSHRLHRHHRPHLHRGKEARTAGTTSGRVSTRAGAAPSAGAARRRGFAFGAS